ncbi:hypothetical protein COO91_03192 [Nostoc flagelliforme CCNUN1]|uniref:Uncharacterized protein n=1 Tax=Nostoc flagelliforme CCNUN1 TaxID=2038116 RepID=A0A2K8SP50_9NOSO|nr:hypothetical protein COO91_03192 [Nostoc flagelliforme CCNUN1]
MQVIYKAFKFSEVFFIFQEQQRQAIYTLIMALCRLGVKTTLRGSSGISVTLKRWLLFSFSELFLAHK